MNSEYFECRCFSDEHTLRFALDEDHGDIFAGVFLHNWEPFYKRVWIAIKYIFGYKCRYGHWDTFMMKSEDYNRLRALLDASEKALTSKRERYIVKKD